MYVYFNIVTVLINFVPFKTNHCSFPLRYVFMVNADTYGVVLKILLTSLTANICLTVHSQGLTTDPYSKLHLNIHALHITDVSISSFLLSFLVSRHLSRSADRQTRRYRPNSTRVRPPSTAKEQRLMIKQNPTNCRVRAP